MARRKEATVLLLDVGPRMHPHLAHVSRCAADFLTGKMLYRAQAEVGLTLFGTTGTDNAPQREAEAQGLAGQYQHIEERHDVGLPDGAYLKTVLNLPQGQGASDFFDGLAVAAARLSAPELATVDKRIVVVSNFCSRVEVDAASVEQLVAGMQTRGMRLDLLSLDTPEDNDLYGDDRLHNLSVLADIGQELHTTERSFRCGADLLGAFRAHEVATTTYYSGPLELLGSQLQIMVKLATKTKVERLMSAAKETPAQREAADDGLPVEGGLSRTKHWQYVDAEVAAAEGKEEEGFELEPDDIMRAYAYGRNLVGVLPEEVAEYKLATTKGLQLVGFVDQEAIPRHLYMKECHVAVADKAKPASQAALAALVQAMQRKGKSAILRFVWRDMLKPQLWVGLAVGGTAAAPPHLLLHTLPFLEDIRDYKFSSFQKRSWLPTTDQVDAARAVVSAMGLGEGPLEELLAPEATPNPQIHRQYWELCRRAVLGGKTPLQEEDELAQHIYQPRLEALPGAAAALEAAAAALPMGQAARAGRRAARKALSVENPMNEFEAMLAEEGEGGDEEAALQALAEVIPHVVLGNVGESRFDEAAVLVEALRDACVQRTLFRPFNDLMKALQKKLATQPDKKGFLAKLENRGVRLITAEEVEGADADRDKAERFAASTQQMLVG